MTTAVTSSPPHAVAPALPWRILAGIARVATTALLCGGVAVFVFLAVGPHVLGYRTASMLSGSMSPHIRPGDVVIDTPEPLRAVHVGQVLTFHTPTPTQYVDSHRVIEVRHLANGRIAIRTKGDANTSPDAWLAILQGDTAWQVRSVVPHLGTAIYELRNPRLHALLMWVTPGLLIIVLLFAIWSPDPAAVAPAGVAPGGVVSGGVVVAPGGVVSGGAAVAPGGVVSGGAAVAPAGVAPGGVVSGGVVSGGAAVAPAAVAPAAVAPGGVAVGWSPAAAQDAHSDR